MLQWNKPKGIVVCIRNWRKICARSLALMLFAFNQTGISGQEVFLDLVEMEKPFNCQQLHLILHVWFTQVTPEYLKLCLKTLVCLFIIFPIQWSAR